MKIIDVHARELLDSRGNPTVEVELSLDGDIAGRAIVPSGASTGAHEAVELRDGDPDRFIGKGVLKAVENVNTVIKNKLINEVIDSQEDLDNRLIDLDGSSNKSNLGANATLGVSMAYARTKALYDNIPLYKSFINNFEFMMPTPMINIINGGSHANNNVDFQEFMIFPIGAKSFSHAIQMSAEIFYHLQSILNQKGYSTAVGDEGGFAPNLRSNQEAIEVILEAVNNTPYKAGKEISLALDVAASELFTNDKYRLVSEDKNLSNDQMIDYLSSLVNQYPILSIEDGLDQNDWAGWKKLNASIGDKCQIVGDDLTVTNKVHLAKSIEQKSMNAILIKLNQIGTVTEAIEAIELANKHKFGSIISHRSGETEDTIIADFSVSMGTGQIKTGSLSRTDRVAKYNQLLRIEEQLGAKAIFAGAKKLAIKIK